MPFVIAYRYHPDQEWVKNHDQVFENGNEASEYCKTRNSLYKQWGESTRLRVMPIPIEDPLAWRLREEAKFADGTYQRPPWHGDYASTMLEHIDPNDPSKVRFFDGEQDAHRNRYTSMAPGRFFTRYIYGDPPPGLVEKYCAKMGLDVTVSKLKLATTADEIEYVYTNGPHSCMAYPVNQRKFVDSKIHPVRVYGDLDLACAYITRSGDITGRCMVWPAQKIHGRIYGDYDRMIERLSEEGYTENWHFIGARLQLLKTKGGDIIAPYIDGEDLGGRIEDGYIVLTDEPYLIMKSPDGIVEASSCSRCGATEVALEWCNDWDGYVCNPCFCKAD